MARVEYYEYIQSPEWRVRANAAKSRVSYRCQVCNRSANEITLDAHHRTYERLGHESPDDVTVLCRDCHELYEREKRLPKPPPRRGIHSNGSPPPSLTPPIPESRRTTLVPTGNGPKPVILPSIPSEYQLEEEPVEHGDTSDDEAWDGAIPRHMIVWLGRFVHFFGYTSNAILIIALEWALIAENPINLINPFFHISIVWGMFFSPPFWMFAAIALVGAGLTIASIWLVQKARPRMSVIRWYWRWNPSLLLKVPIFLTSWANGIYASWALIFTIIGVLGGRVEPSLSLFGSNLLRIYFALLLLPIMHLIWDNRLRHVWPKLLMSFVMIPSLLFASLFIELWWGAEMCDDGIGEDSMCQLYSTFPSWSSILSALSEEGPTPTPMPTQTVAVTPSPLPLGNGEWTQFTSKTGLVNLEYPAEWLVLRDAEESIELQGADTAFTFFLMPGNTEGEIVVAINSSVQDSDFADNYNEPLREYLKIEFEKFGGGLNSLGNPIIETIGTYSTISNDVSYFETLSGVTQAKRMWLYFFDCGSYLCQVIYSKNDAKPVTEEQLQIAEYMIASIKVRTFAPVIPASQPTSIPRPTQVTDSSNVFSGLSFCHESEFSVVAKRCTRHRDVFTGTVEELYVSWTPSKEYKGASFLKKWYLDGKHFLDSESTNNYGYLEVDMRTSLKPGNYMVDLYVSEKLVAQGNFTIR